MLLAGAACKKQQPDVTVAPAAPVVQRSQSPAPTASAEKPHKSDAAGVVKDAGVLDAGTRDAAPQRLVVRTAARPDCKDPPPLLTEEGTRLFVHGMNDLPQTWGVVTYGTYDWRIEKHVTVVKVDSNYFSGLEPNRQAVILQGGEARMFAVSEKWSRKLDDGFQPTWLGTLSDHCMPVAPDDRTLLFSIRLSQTAALQGLLERESKVHDLTNHFKNEQFGDPELHMPQEMIRALPVQDRRTRDVKALRLRTVKLPWDGTVLHEGPRLEFYFGATLDLNMFDERPDTPIVFSINNPPWASVMTVVSRTGDFLLHMPKPCGEHHTLIVWTFRDPEGVLHLEPRESTYSCLPSDDLAAIRAKIQPTHSGTMDASGGR